MKETLLQGGTPLQGPVISLGDVKKPYSLDCMEGKFSEDEMRRPIPRAVP
jgi:hypothetical protein